MKIRDPEMADGYDPARPVTLIASRTDREPGVIVLGQFVGGGYFVTRYSADGVPMPVTRWDVPDRGRAMGIFERW